MGRYTDQSLQVGTAEKAKEIVSDSRFPPIGRRGFGSPISPGLWGVSANEYASTANESILVMVQIETREAVDNIEAIANVEGLGGFRFSHLFSTPIYSMYLNIDVLFIGPYDLSMSLGYDRPSPDPHPEVEKVIHRIRDVAHNAGKKVYVIYGFLIWFGYIYYGS